MEWGFALLAHQINRALGGKKTMEDFMPYADKEDDREISLTEAMERWQ